jgi:hypothetical protein
MPDTLPENVSVTYWCNSCNAEPASDTIDVELNGQWVPLDIGDNCLGRLQAGGYI